MLNVQHICKCWNSLAKHCLAVKELNWFPVEERIVFKNQQARPCKILQKCHTSTQIYTYSTEQSRTTVDFLKFKYVSAGSVIATFCNLSSPMLSHGNFSNTYSRAHTLVQTTRVHVQTTQVSSETRNPPQNLFLADYTVDGDDDNVTGIGRGRRNLDSVQCLCVTAFSDQLLTMQRTKVAVSKTLDQNHLQKTTEWQVIINL